MPDRPDANFWKRKLMAFLHDPPCKALDVGPEHERIASGFIRAAFPGVDEEWLRDTNRAIKDSDWTAAAADRFAFPRGKCPADFASRPEFRHPLGGASRELRVPTTAFAEEILQASCGGIRVDESKPEADQWRQRFFLYWRRWMEQTVLMDKKGARDLAYYPADTRIPDHTIWTHMSLASALEACRVDGTIRPAFLCFQLGPVQDFIAAARSTRDLWSGSYILSWLTANAIKAVTDQVGPDCVIFPALRGQGIFDVLHREEVYSTIFYRAGDHDEEQAHSLWDRMMQNGSKQDRDRMAGLLLNPTLPNRFVAIVPETLAGGLGRDAAGAVRATLGEISNACWQTFAKLAGGAGANSAHLDGMKTRWDAQVAAFPQVTWASVPWRHDIDQAIADFARLPLNRAGETWTPGTALAAARDLAKRVGLPPNNPGFLWSVNYHRADFALAARRNTHDFGQFVTDDHQAGTPKDALTGREEIIGDEDFWERLGGDHFKSNEGPYGAITIIKRLWWRDETGFLKAKLGIDQRSLRKVMTVDSVADIAIRNTPKQERDRLPLNDDGERIPPNPYVAVIALDGDGMGKWIGGANMPAFLDQLAPEARRFFESELKIDAHFPRLLTPAYHAQFSEALANFANHVAGRIVTHYDGQLVYAGGDDVLAMVPSVHALACARALRAAFRGKVGELPEPHNSYRLAMVNDGFVVTDEEYPLTVPGPATDVSCGIAIAHYQHPLQHIVAEAHAAEHRAKHDLDRAAFAVSLMKRGGETIHWGAKWDGGALALYDLYRGLRSSGRLTSRFPYALAELLKPYDLEKRFRLEQPAVFDARQVIEVELDHVTGRQGNWTDGGGAERCEFRVRCLNYLDAIAEARPADFAKLFLTAAFIDRDRSDRGGDHA